MEPKNLERNLRLYAWFRIFKEPLFWGPVLISFITNIGKMELSEVYFMESVVVLGMVVFGIYSSTWADLLGRKRVIILGAFLNLSAIILFSLINSPLLVWLSNILIMIGFALISGVDEAFLVDALKDAGRQEEFTRINGRIIARRFALVSLCSIASGYLYAIDPRLPMYLSIPGVAVALAAASLFGEPPRAKTASQRKHFSLMKLSVLFAFNNKTVRWIIGFVALAAAASKLWFFTFNPYFEQVKLTPEYFGWIFFVCNLVSWSTSRYVHTLEKRLGERTAIVMITVLSALPIMLMGTFACQLAVALIFFDSLTRGFKEPFFAGFINKHLDSKNRATILSINYAARELIGALSLAIFGLVLARYELGISLQFLGAAILALGALSLWQYQVIFRK